MYIKFSLQKILLYFNFVNDDNDDNNDINKVGFGVKLKYNRYFKTQRELSFVGFPSDLKISNRQSYGTNLRSYVYIEIEYSSTFAIQCKRNDSLRWDCNVVTCIPLKFKMSERLIYNSY